MRKKHEKKQELKKHQKPLSFSALKAVWDKKLSQSGWVDAEDSQGRLREWHSYAFMRPRLRNGTLEANQRYYELADNMLQSDSIFDTAMHRSIWRLHATGATVREIGKTLSVSKSFVHSVVSKYRKLIVP